jgi:hypothetical protein
MPLVWEKVGFPFVAGLDGKKDPKQVQAPSLLEMENVRQDRTGEIEKRTGWATKAVTPIGTGKALTSAAMMAAVDNQLLVAGHVKTSGKTTETDGPKMYSLDESGDQLVEVGNYTPIGIDIDSVSRPAEDIRTPDVAETNGFRAYVWEVDDLVSGHGSFITIIDTITGAIVVDSEWLNTLAQAPRIHAVNGKFVILSASPGTNRIARIVIDTAAITTIPVGTNIIFDLLSVGGTGHWDTTVAIDPTYGECVEIAYHNTSGTASKITVCAIDDTGAIQRTTARPGDPNNAITIARVYDYNSATAYLATAWRQTGTNQIQYELLNLHHTVALAATNLYVEASAIRNLTLIEDPSYDTGTPGNSSMALFIEVASAALEVKTVFARFTGAAASPVHSIHWGQLASKAFMYGDRPRVLLVSWPEVTADLQVTYYLASVVQDARSAHTYTPWIYLVEAYILPRVAGGYWSATEWTHREGYLPHVSLGSPGKYRIAGARQMRLLAKYEQTRSVVGIGLDFTATGQAVTTLGPSASAQVAGGVVCGYDGRITEQGFLAWPYITTPVLGAGAITAGTRQYRAIYQWTDRHGQVHRSAASLAQSVIFAGVQNCTCSIAAARWGEHFKCEEIEVILYRTVSGGEVFYRVGSGANDRTARYIVIVDNDIDSSITDKEVLYTVGGEVDNMAPPAASVIHERRDRVLVVPDEDRTAIWGSKPKAEGTGLEFSGYLVKRVEEGGDIIGLAGIDNTEFVFKENQIRGFAGDGPNAMGQGIFGPDRLISADVGLTDRRAMAQIDPGIIFKSKKGIMLLGRDGQVVPIGLPAAGYDSYDVISIVPVPASSQVRFGLSGTPNMLVWDYLHNVWGIYTNHTQIDSTVWLDQFCHLTASGAIHVEGAGYQDDSTDIDLKAGSAWINVAGLQGFKRVRRAYILGEFKAAHTLTIEIMYDYVDTVIETVTATVSSNPAPYQFGFRPGLQKCEAFRCRVTDTASGDSLAISGLAFEIGSKRGLRKLGPAKTL